MANAAFNKSLLDQLINSPLIIRAILAFLIDCLVVMVVVLNVPLLERNYAVAIRNKLWLHSGLHYSTNNRKTISLRNEQPAIKLMQNSSLER